jgi:serine/threonine protein kinase
MVSGEGMRLARKDFELNAADRAYEQERNVLRDIVRNAKQHNNIMKSLGSLEIGLTYSIFMPLADCDLKHYMELHPKSPSGHLQKANLVECAVGLAGAIVYLHEELESPTYERLSCFHMDLKPQNILVINDPTTGKEQWKLSDFNMSRVKMRGNITDGQMALRRTNTVNDTVFEINKLFKRRMPDAADIPTADFTINRRGTGTYLAPEACVDRHPVQAESDIWSLGCVISVVFTYLHGGQAAVESFADSRYKKGMDDRFFSFTGSSALHRISDAQINDGVTRWHKQIRLETKQAHSEEGAIFETMIKFLERQVLIIDPRRRQETTADHVRKKLIESLKAFETMSDDDDNTGGKGPGLRDKVRNLLQSGTKTHTQYGEMLPTATVVKTCTFGPNGHPLVCVTDTSLAAYSLDHVLLSGGVKDTRNFKGDLMKYGEATPRDKGRLWSPNIGVSAQYILAATDHHAFDVRKFPSTSISLTCFSVTSTTSPNLETIVVSSG